MPLEVSSTPFLYPVALEPSNTLHFEKSAAIAIYLELNETE